jgi:hypothetical protein
VKLVDSRYVVRRQVMTVSDTQQTQLLIDAASDLPVTAIMPCDVVVLSHRNFFTIINAS